MKTLLTFASKLCHKKVLELANKLSVSGEKSRNRRKLLGANWDSELGLGMWSDLSKK